MSGTNATLRADAATGNRPAVANRCPTRYGLPGTRSRRVTAARRRELRVRRIVDADEGQPVRGCHGDVRDPLVSLQQRGGPVDGAATAADVEQRPDQAAHHRVAERVGRHRHLDDPVRAAGPVEALQRPHRRRALAALAERGEVVLAEQRGGRSRHGVEVQRMRPRQRVAGTQRVGAPGRGGDPVAVVAPQGREPRVELRRHGRDRGDPDVGGQHPGEPAHQPRGVEVVGQVRRRDLPGGVHAGVGAAGHREHDRPPQHGGQRTDQDARDRAPAGLDGPAGEVGAVVGDVEPEPGAYRYRRRRGPGEGSRNGDEPAVRTDGGLDCVGR